MLASSKLKSFGRYVCYFAVPAIVLGSVLLYQGRSHSARAVKRELARITEQVTRDLGTAALVAADAGWDRRVDSANAAERIKNSWGSIDEILRKTIAGYAYPDGRNACEGFAISDLEGRLLHRQASDIDDLANTIDNPKFEKIIGNAKFLKDPWLSDYRFVAEHFQKKTEETTYVSPIIPADQRNLMIIAAKIDDQRILICQYNTQQLYEQLLKENLKSGYHFAMVDSNGDIGITNTTTAEDIVKSTLAPRIRSIIYEAGYTADQADRTISGYFKTEHNGKTFDIFYKNVEDNFVLMMALDNDEIKMNVYAMSGDYMQSAYLALAMLGISNLFGAYILARQEKKSAEYRAAVMSIGTMEQHANTSLQVILGNLTLLGVDPLTDEQREYLAGAENGVQRLTATIAEYMQAAREKNLVIASLTGTNIYKIKGGKDVGN